jgi:hypothetical protein
VSEKVWLGRIYLKSEGGYEIVLKALNHYKKRLRNIDASPELAGAPMFVQIVQQEASKTYPAVNALISKITKGLEDSETLNSIQTDVPLMERALKCYQSDIEKMKNGDEFYSSLIGSVEAGRELTDTQVALEKINQFA